MAGLVDRTRVVALRKALKITQKDLAARMKVDVAVVQGWENGQMFPTIKHTKMLESFEDAARSAMNSAPTAVASAAAVDSPASHVDASWADVLADPEFLAAIRKAVANPALREAFIRVARPFADPAERRY